MSLAVGKSISIQQREAFISGATISGSENLFSFFLI